MLMKNAFIVVCMLFSACPLFSQKLIVLAKLFMEKGI